jgi:hypothetical protein
MARAVFESIALTPIAVTETTYSTSNPNLASSSWFVNFTEGTDTSVVPRQLRLFGTTTTARLLARKSMIVQCSRCCAHPANAASTALQSTWKRITTTAVIPPPLTNAPHGAYTATGPTQLTRLPAFSTLARQA